MPEFQDYDEIVLDLIPHTNRAFRVYVLSQLIKDVYRKWEAGPMSRSQARNVIGNQTFMTW